MEVEKRKRQLNEEQKGEEGILLEEKEDDITKGGVLFRKVKRGRRLTWKNSKDRIVRKKKVGGD